MHFAFDDEQRELQRAVRNLLGKVCSSTDVRAAWSNATGRTEQAWPRLGEMGVLAGLDPLDLVLVLEEAGRAALPEPIVEHAAVAAPLLVDHTGVASGEVTVTVGVSANPFVLDADTAALLLLQRETSLFLVERDAVSLIPMSSVDASRRLFAVQWQGGTEIGDATRAFDHGALGTAAQLIGLAQHLLDTTVDYATQREQFGVPIGSFQAVKHHLANVALKLEFARPLVYRAAYSMAHHADEHSVHVSMAKAAASDAAIFASRQALQVHGAIGYTTEYDLHLWMKRAWALAAAWGDAAWHRARVGRAIL